MVKKEFYDNFRGNEIYRYTIFGEITVSFITLGARVMDLFVPDKNGKPVDVSLNMKGAEDVFSKSGFMGATIGRCANRMGGDGFTLSGEEYKFTRFGSDAHLHGGVEGFDKRIFDAETGENSITFSYLSRDGEEGYPGNLDFKVRYTVVGKKLVIEYFGICDKDTLLNPTNHTYFNLSGEGSDTILDHYLSINADAYTPTDEKQVPTGKLTSVDGTPFDFRSPKPIGRDINADDADLKIGGGYDHNFRLTDSHFAKVYSPKSGIVMDGYTDMPGVQFYAGNLLNGEAGKSVYARYSAFCLESQFFPDAIHHPEWKSPVLKAGERFYSKTEYAFSVRK